MTPKAKEQLKLLHIQVLRAHSVLLKKHNEMIKADKVILAPEAKGTITKKDIANYSKTQKEAYKAHEKWVNVQLKYFKFIEKNSGR
jgi:Ni2+-binding GTPase involved in maturation of urease and hydrogenase